jgi:hypothetical protein
VKACIYRGDAGRAGVDRRHNLHRAAVDPFGAQPAANLTDALEDVGFRTGNETRAPLAAFERVDLGHPPMSHIVRDSGDAALGALAHHLIENGPRGFDMIAQGMEG